MRAILPGSTSSAGVEATVQRFKKSDVNHVCDEQESAGDSVSFKLLDSTPHSDMHPFTRTQELVAHARFSDDNQNHDS